MKLRLLEKEQSVQSVQIGVERTVNINIYRSIVLSVLSVLSIFYLSREGARNICISYLSLPKLPRVWKFERTESTERTECLQLLIFLYSLLLGRAYKSVQLPKLESTGNRRPSYE
jgi:hypothetical protein